ncbi:hypothetical protein GE09DRAFT_1258290, partial [Coniochaeta sp. 2T2.1]
MSDFNNTPTGNQPNGSQEAPFVQPTLPASDQSAKTLWMGEMEPWMDEKLHQAGVPDCPRRAGSRLMVFATATRVCWLLLRSRFGTPEASAQKALALNGTGVPNSHRSFKLNWASGGGLVDRRDDRGPEYSIFVGDLGPEVNEFVLVSLFQGRFASCKSAKIMTDAVTGQSRGYGF